MFWKLSRLEDNDWKGDISAEWHHSRHCLFLSTFAAKFAKYLDGEMEAAAEKEDEEEAETVLLASSLVLPPIMDGINAICCCPFPPVAGEAANNAKAAPVES